MKHLNIWMLWGFFLMSIAWFLPNTYRPWLSAWQEASALASVLMFCSAAWQLTKTLKNNIKIFLSPFLLILVLLLVMSLSFQIITGIIYFTGDAIMVFSYLFAWFLAVYSGYIISQANPQNIDAFWFAVLLSAIFSVGLALVQWLDIEGLNIFILDMRPGGRPFANLGQPNNFCTLCFLGCVSLLYFHERGTVHKVSFWLGWCWLSFGIALSQSRTGWVQIICLIAILWFLSKRVPFRLKPKVLIGLGTIFFAWIAILPLLANKLLISTARTLGNQIQGDIRTKYWLSMLHAIAERPLTGYGWLQTGLAQQLNDHPLSTGGIFDFSHNIVLDLILWAGLPIGLPILFCFLCWFIIIIYNIKESISAVIFLAIAGLLIHASLEYPLAYAYFLIPFGFLMGALSGICNSGTGWIVKRLPMGMCTVFLATLLLLISRDYFLAETATRDLRFESARIGTEAELVEIPDMLLLNQLQALMHYGYRDPHENISKEDWEKTRIVSERYGLSFIMFRYALASAFRGEAVIANNTLTKICQIHSFDKCQYARFEWKRWGEKYPNLVGTIAFPNKT